MHTILHETTWAWQTTHYTVVPPAFSHLCFNDQWRLESELWSSDSVFHRFKSALSLHILKPNSIYTKVEKIAGESHCLVW